MSRKINLTPFWAKIIGFFQSFTVAILAGEGTALEFLVALGLWAVYLTPASMTYGHVKDSLGFSPFFAGSTAFAVEVLGIASGHTLARFFQHNREKENRAKANKLSLLPMLFSYVMYLIILTAINVILDYRLKDTPTILAQVGLILLTTPAIIIVAVRSQHREILNRNVQTVQGKTVERSAKRSERSELPQTVIVMNYLQEGYKAGSITHAEQVPQARELSRILNVAPSSAQRARIDFINNHNNGKVEVE